MQIQKYGKDIQVGDVIEVWFNGGQAQVNQLTPYEGSLLEVLGEGTQIASFRGCSSEITLCAKSVYKLVS